MSNIRSSRPIDTGEYIKVQNVRVYAQYSAPVGREVNLRLPFIVEVEVAQNKRFKADPELAQLKIIEALNKMRIGLYLTDDMEEAMQAGEQISNEKWDELWAIQCLRVSSSILHYLRAGAKLPPMFVKSISVNFGLQSYQSDK